MEGQIGEHRYPSSRKNARIHGQLTCRVLRSERLFDRNSYPPTNSCRHIYDTPIQGAS